MVEVTEAHKFATALIGVERFTADGNFHPDYLAMLDKYRQAGVQQGLDMAKAALEADAKLCDCHAYSEGECACGAWCEWKTITSARAVEIVSKLGGEDA